MSSAPTKAPALSHCDDGRNGARGGGGALAVHVPEHVAVGRGGGRGRGVPLGCTEMYGLIRKFTALSVVSN